MNEELWVAEYNPVQKQFHHDSLERVLKTNAGNLHRHHEAGAHETLCWVVFAVGTSEETSDAIEKMREALGLERREL